MASLEVEGRGGGGTAARLGLPLAPITSGTPVAAKHGRYSPSCLSGFSELENETGREAGKS